MQSKKEPIPDIPLLPKDETDEEFQQIEVLSKKDQIKSTLKVFPLIVNGAIGTGIFGLPFAYYEAGVYPSLIILIIYFVINNITCCYLLESLSRLNVLPYHPKIQVEKKDYYGELTIDKTFGFTEISYRLSGNILKYVGVTALALNCYSVLWAYIATCITTVKTVFWLFMGEPDQCTGEGTHFEQPWECLLTYYIVLIIYGVIVIPISFLDMGKQSILQTVLTVVRFAAFIVMIITCIIQICVSGPIQHERTIFNSYWSGFGTMFAHSAFSSLVQHQIPGMIEPVKGHKKYVHFAIMSALSVSSVFYLLVSVICAYTFNSQVQNPVTLNWSNYTGRNGGWGGGKEIWIGYIIKYFIMLFPVFNLTSTFPLQANTLGANLMNLLPQKWFEKRKNNDKNNENDEQYLLEEEKNNEIEIDERKKKIFKYICKAIAIFPPFIMSCFIDSLEVIFDFSGIIAFFLAFSLPCIYVFMSLYRFNKFTWFIVNPKTPYTNKVISTPFMIIMIFVITLISFFIALYFLIVDTIESFSGGDDEGSFSFE